MALSFEESLKAASKRTVSETAVAAPAAPLNDVGVMTEDIGIMTLAEEAPIAAYAGDMDEWTLLNGYLLYEDYSDDRVSTVDESKNISLNQDQINLTQESNSQFIPFQMPRYYDGFDLSRQSLLIHYVNKNGYEDYAVPINAYVSSSKIKFGWLVDKKVTAIEGKVQFEIQAIGANSKGDEYVWKTKPCDGLNILKSLAGNGVIEPDNSWMTSFITQITEQVGLAQTASRSAQNAADDARAAVNLAETAAQNAEQTVATAKEELETTVQDAVIAEIAASLAGYFTKSEAEEIHEAIQADIAEIALALESMDGLAAFNVEYNGSVMTFYNGETVMKSIEINSDPSAEWTNAYTITVDEKIAAVKGEAIGALDAYKETVNADLEAIHADIDGLPETLATDYYTKTDADERYATKTSLESTNTSVSTVEAAANTNKSNIAALGTKIAEMEEIIGSVDTSPRLSYEATYDEESVYTLWEIEGEGDEAIRTPKGQFKIVGGSGGAATSSVLKIEYVTKTPYVVTVNDDAVIAYNFSGTDSSGDAVLEGTATWKVGNTVVATQTIAAGENTFDVTDYISVGSQKVLLSIADDNGSLATKSWTVQKIDVRMESDFNDTVVYPMGELSFDYTPYGAVSKDIHFVLDGRELTGVTTTVSGIPMAYRLPAQEHGAHLLEAYITASLNNGANVITSNKISKDIIWYDAATGIPVIGCSQQEFTARQHDTTNISLTVYDPATETPKITLAVDGSVISEPVLDGNTYVWQYKSTDVGDHELTVTCGETVKVLTAHIEELDIDLEPVTANLAFDFNPSGKSNNADRVWSDGDVHMTVSENFDWVNGGYQIDENGDTYFCVKAGTSAEIDYKLFADDAKANGKEFKLVFKTTNVANPEAMFLHCMDNTIGTDNIGIQMRVHEAEIFAQTEETLVLPYSENDIIEFEFNVSKGSEATPMVMGYEDGVSTRPMVYTESNSFSQNTPRNISLGSEDCDLHIYRMKAYKTSLNARGILNNFIADARSAEEMLKRYDRNQIYDENQNLDPDVLAEKCPWLRVYKLSAPYFTNNKSDKVPGTTIQQLYKDGDAKLDNWTCYNAMHSGQGTSSNNYGAAGRNLDFIMNKSGVEGVEPYFKLGDGSIVDEITMTRTSVPTAYLNAKVNIASSNNMTNALLANRYNQFNPYRRPFVRDEGEDTNFIKDTMEFHNCVIFIQETDEDLSTHREFADTAWHFYAIGNIGDSKKTDKTRLTDPDDKYECCVEIMDVELPLSDFPANTMVNAMGQKTDEVTQVKEYIWAKNENLGILHELIDGEYVLTSDTEVDLTKTYYVDILEHDDFSEDFTYGWRYLYEGDDDAENAEVFDFCKRKWIELYRFITTSTDEEFKARIGDYFVLDSALYYYLFTTRYCMVDNRAKNTFWHYGKTGEVDADGNPIRKFDLCWNYDNDTALGLNNYGKQVYRYGLEDTDRDEKGEEIFREMDSTFFCRIRNLFHAELKAMYQELESKNAWHAESFINQADAWQSEFPEELWRLDIERKYIRTYTGSFINGEADSQFLVNMANGKMKYHRREWERNQEKYMASKYQSSVASADSAELRCAKPDGNLVVKPNYRLKLTPYAYMYLNVDYGTQGTIQMRAEPNVEYEIPFEGDSTDIIKIYSSSCLRSLGDLSTCYPATVSTTRASKIRELIIGNGTDGYDNPYFTTLTTGANYLLEELNVENVSGLTQALQLNDLGNLKELYARGSKASGVTFADGGKIETAELPAVGSVTMRNLAYLTNLDIADFSKLTALTVENCPSVDVINILDSARNINRVRITGIDWNLEDTTLLERLYLLKGKDKDGYDIDHAVVAGKVRVPVIRQQALYEYGVRWPDLEVVFDQMIEQFPVTFVNDDGTVLEVQYVDTGKSAIDPTTRAENPLRPTKESTVSHDFTFSNWDVGLTNVFAPRTVRAIYTSSLRKYTVKYVSKGTTVQESIGDYGTNIPYTGATPTYTGLESSYTYCLFNRWDKSGIVDGDKTINAIFDEYHYTGDGFAGRDISEMPPVELYALLKLAASTTQDTSKPLYIGNIVEDKDSITFALGNDVDFDDIESYELITSPTAFGGASQIVDTGIKLFEEDRDFVLALDYEFHSGNSNGAVLAQCFQGSGSNGFKLLYNSSGNFSGARFVWGTSYENLVSPGNREMLVVRHKKGENGLTIYKSNLGGLSVTSAELTKNATTSASATLVFGGEKADDGFFNDGKFANGNINWCKLWFMDLGDTECRNLAMWTHESITLENCGFRRYALSDGSGGRCTMTMLASHLLDRKMAWGNSNAGGWANATLNQVLNYRLYHAIPHQIRSLIKQVDIPSSIGEKSTEISTSPCYIAVPSRIELDGSVSTEPYINEGTVIPWLYAANSNAGNTNRIRCYEDGIAGVYWTRSPDVSSDTYIYNVTATGQITSYQYAYGNNGVLIMLSL